MLKILTLLVVTELTNAKPVTFGWFQSCVLFYDRADNTNDTGLTHECFDNPPMPCNCAFAPDLADDLSDNNPATFFTLSDNSFLEAQIKLNRSTGDEIYILTSVSFSWGPDEGQRIPFNTSDSYFELKDESTGGTEWIPFPVTDLDINYDGTNNVTTWAINQWTLSNADPQQFLWKYSTFLIRFRFSWDSPANSSGIINLLNLVVDGSDATRDPTPGPTNIPTHDPTTDPTTIPTEDPTPAPTDAPTTPPTNAPSASPTFTIVQRRTKLAENSYFEHSDNIEALYDRPPVGNWTYANYKLPDIVQANGNIKKGRDRPLCLTCILAWADIDASIDLIGCPEDKWDWNDTNPNNERSIYHCTNGTWVLRTSGALADWQDTYGRLEIWEVDDRGIKWLQYNYEFNWINDTCYFDVDDPLTIEHETEDCPVLPLTGDQDLAAYFEFTMPKRYGDSRNAPLIVVWYDLLSIPYSIRPELGYEFTNFTFEPIEQGQQFGLEDVMTQFQPAMVAAGILMACFLAVMILSCFVSGDRKGKKDFMIDTRNLRTTFRHTPETIIVPPNQIKNRASFSCARHGPWLIVVLMARLMYMFVFTFIFFYLVFKSINKEHFDILAQYDDFAVQRDAQLKDYSYGIETYYANETNRMERELEFRQTYCYTAYINKTLLRYKTGGKHQIDYHTNQINNPLGNISVNFSTVKSIYILGDGMTACSTSLSDGAIVWLNSLTDPRLQYVPQITKKSIINGTNQTETTIIDGNLTTLSANGYNTGWANFSQFESIIGPVCEEATWCYGWGFVNKDVANGVPKAYYAMFNEMADPAIEEGVYGICYGATKLDEELALLTFNSSYFESYADKLFEQNLKDFQSYADDMYDTLQGVWQALRTFDPDAGIPIGPFELLMESKKNLTDSAGYGLGVEPCGDGEPIYNDTICAGVCYEMCLTVNCKTCPAGDFTNQSLASITDYFLNGSNISEFTAMQSLPVNVSNLVSINAEFIELPELPTITLPFEFNFPFNFDLILQISVTLDLLLLIYRWYITTGIVARIVRGKDVEVALSHLKVDTRGGGSRCCKGETLIDLCLSCILYCNDKVRNLGYNFYKLFFWVWILFKLAIVALLIMMLYYCIDQLVTVEFIEGIGAFQLMTIGLGAQRLVRNQVLGSSSAAYNNYTLTGMEESIRKNAQERNDDAWQQNLAELARVDNWNALFCRGWVAYQTSPREVTQESPTKQWTDLNTTALVDRTKVMNQGSYFTYRTLNGDTSMDTADIMNLFDHDPTTSWKPYPNPNVTAPNDTDVQIDFYLSPIYMNDKGDHTWWDIVQISFDWNFTYDEDVPPGVTPIEFEIVLDVNNTGNLEEISYPNGNTFAPAEQNGIRQTMPSSITTVSPSDEVNTPIVRIILRDVKRWGTEYFLNGITIAGHAPESEVICPQVQFRFWQFDGSSTDNENATAEVRDTPTEKRPDATTYYDADGTYIEFCPTITPIFGEMYRGFVRTWLNEQLVAGHEPFILALRNIALSPFYLAIVMVGVLFFAYLFAFLMEWFLMKLNLYRENPWARVPLVTTNWDKYTDQYKKDMHETDKKGTIYGMGGTEMYSAPAVPGDGHDRQLLSDDATGIEMGLTKGVSLKGRAGAATYGTANSNTNDDYEEWEA